MRNKAFHIARCTEIGRFSANNGAARGLGALKADIKLNSPFIVMGKVAPRIHPAIVRSLVPAICASPTLSRFRPLLALAPCNPLPALGFVTMVKCSAIIVSVA